MEEHEFTPEQVQILNAFLSGVLYQARGIVVELDSDVDWARFGRTVFKAAETYQERVNNAADSVPDAAEGEAQS